MTRCAMRRICLTVATAVIFIIAAGPVSAYMPGVHRRIGERAVDVSTADRVLKDQFGLLAGKHQVLRSRTGQARSLRQWIGEGAYEEDNPSWRALNHFHTPLRPWPDAGLIVAGTSVGVSSIYWQQNPNQVDGGTWSWPFARRRFHDFLTSPDQAERDEALADVARAIGQISHLIQDATSPAHTRNDQHLRYDGYEATTERWRLEDPIRFQQLLAGSVTANPAIFTPTGDTFAPATIARLIDSDNYTGAQPPGNGTLIGNSEYTSGGYVSDDRIFRDFPFPSPASLGPPFFDPPEGTQGARRYFPKDFDGDKVSHFVAEGTLWERLNFRGQRLEGYILDARTYEAAGRHLVARAVGYSASLIDRFFQRELEISAPARYVYGRTTFEDNNSGEFTKLTFKVRKTTPGATGAGMLTAIVRYRKGLDNLIESPFSISDKFTYALSSGVPATLSSTATEWTFDFGAYPIPTNSADVYLTVVFRGPSGAEQTAVLYGDKDLFEPDPVTAGNATDYDCFGPQPYHVGDFAIFPPFDFNNRDPILNPQARDLSNPKDGTPELVGPNDEIDNIPMKVTSNAGPFASSTTFDYRVARRVAQPQPEYARFVVLQDQPSYFLSWRPGRIQFKGSVPNSFSVNPLLITAPRANVNRVFVDAAGNVRHEVLLPFEYRGVTTVGSLTLLVPDNARFNACVANTVALPPSFVRVVGTPAAP